jgi:hypothetical protein
VRTTLSEGSYTDKTYAAEHPRRERKHGRQCYQTPPIVTLDGLNGKAELSGNQTKK